MPIDWKSRTAIFGGSFDPPHLSHARAIQGLFRFPGVERVVVIPAASPPHKPCRATPEQRLEMARLALASAGQVEVSDLEIRRAKRRPDLPSYSWDTIQELKASYPRLAFVMGSDQLQQFHTWHRFPELLDACDWLVLARKPQGWDAAEKVLSQWTASGLVKSQRAGDQQSLWKTRLGTSVALVQTEAPALSSTDVREAIAKTGEPPENSVCSAVLAYLKANRIYGTTGAPQ